MALKGERLCTFVQYVEVFHKLLGGGEICEILTNKIMKYVSYVYIANMNDSNLLIDIILA